jgi:pimeloyl-ACP methyl ester carboxylesterase
MWTTSALAATAVLCASVATAEAKELSQGRSSGSADAVRLSACVLPEVARTARCGSLEVLENPDRPNGRRLSIGVAVIPARNEDASADPIAVLMGGPGEDAISAAAFYVQQFGSLLDSHDLLLMDQRGTGRSNALRCELYSTEDPAIHLRRLYRPDAVADCARQLSARADLTQYTFAHFARDLEHVRRALGYGQLNLFAGSYGTRAAQVYVRSYPDSVRTILLGSVVPLDVATPLTFAKTMEHEMEDLFQTCSAAAECRDAFPRLRDEFATILDRLKEGVQVTLPDRANTVLLHPGRVVEWFRSRLYRPATAASVPWLIHRAYLGDWRPIVQGILANAKGFDTAVTAGIFFSTTCSEDVAFIRPEQIEPATASTFLGDYRLREQQAACSTWPRAALPPGYRSLIRSSVPTLFVSGDVDAGSPLWFTERVAPGFSDRLEVTLIGRGHTEWSACIGKLYSEFVRRGTLHGLDASSCGPATRPPFQTR